MGTVNQNLNRMDYKPTETVWVARGGKGGGGQVVHPASL